MRRSVLIGVMVFFVATAAAQDVTDRLLALMAGTYDTRAQGEGETRAGVKLPGRHEMRRVIYAPIAVPHIGPHVLFRQESKDGAITSRGLAVFEAATETGAVRMWLRQFVKPKEFSDLHLRPDAWPRVAIDPAYGGKCPFHWRAAGDGFVGVLDGGRCEIVSNDGRAMAFEARWELTGATLSIFDNTYDGAGALLAGRADRVPTRYDRLTQ